MRTALLTIFLAAAVATSGCYHVTTRTGLPPSAQVHEKRAHMFVFGLIGHESTTTCVPASVETQQTVVDWLLGGLTLGMYTPYSLKVICASGGTLTRSPE